MRIFVDTCSLIEVFLYLYYLLDDFVDINIFYLKYRYNRYMITDPELLQNLTQAISQINSTDLVTLYVPANNNLWLFVEHINKELSTAPNIKNKQLRKSVIQNLQTINYQLKTIKNIPETGLVVCAGNYTIKKTHTTNSREILSCL